MHLYTVQCTYTLNTWSWSQRSLKEKIARTWTMKTIEKIARLCSRWLCKHRQCPQNFEGLLLILQTNNISGNKKYVLIHICTHAHYQRNRRLVFQQYFVMFSPYPLTVIILLQYKINLTVDRWSMSSTRIMRFQMLSKESSNFKIIDLGEGSV